MNKIILIILVILGLGFLLGQYGNFQDYEASLNSQRAVSEYLPQLLERWQEGDRENNYKKNKFNCLMIPNGLEIDNKYFECNPLYLECFIRGQVGLEADHKIRFEGEDYSVKFKKRTPNSKINLHYLELNPKGHLLSLSVGNTEYDILLSNTCNNTFLPQRKYSYGPIKIENVSRRKKIEYEKYDWFWDNRGRNIYLDKYLVSNFQVLQWQDKIGAQFDSITYEKWHLPSTSLSLEQMNKYCEYHNKRLMQAHFMDAASFIPSDEKNINPIKIFKKPYPWTRKKELFEIEQIPKYCGKIYSKECLAKDYNPYHDDSVTWMGLFSVLGGPLEAYNNLIVPDKNLKLSSYYFSLKNSIHEIGKRAYWDGQKQRAEHVFWDSHSYSPLEELKDNVEIGFRCYTEVY